MMLTIQRSTPTDSAAYDVVGRYEQDQVNGLTEALLDALIASVAPRNATSVLDAMGGDGNLSLRLANHCAFRGLPVPSLTLLEYSRVQCEFAALRLAPHGVRIVWGDALGMSSREDDSLVADASFDRVMIKSANHEIPRARQGDLHRSTFRVLRPGGWLVNLGFLFDDAGERDELAEIARVKDGLAGMTDAVTNRHFLTREELYAELAGAGYVDVGTLRSFQYEIRSDVVAEQYFAPACRLDSDLAHQAAQLKALRLRRSGRVRFEGERSLMRCPGEVTYARRPSAIEARDRLSVAHPLEGLRRLPSYAQLVTTIVSALPSAGRIVELGCGPGLLPERLFAGAAHSYLGLDQDATAIARASERFAGEPARTFKTGSVERLRAGYDVAVVGPTALHGSDGDPVAGLAAVVHGLAPGGRLLVIGVPSPDAPARAAATLAPDEPAARSLAYLGGKLAVDPGRYWSVEGLTALLSHLGMAVDMADPVALGGTGHLIQATK